MLALTRRMVAAVRIQSGCVLTIKNARSGRNLTANEIDAPDRADRRAARANR
jgi:hypothetical protein